MEEELKKLAAQWKRKADNDIKTMDNEFASDEPVTDTICFHAQQAAEKYLKLYLLCNNINPMRTHSISVLLAECRKIDPDYSELTEIEYLTDYAVELRYPDSFYIPEIEEAKEAYQDALKVKDFVEKKLNSL